MNVTLPAGVILNTVPLPPPSALASWARQLTVMPCLPQSSARLMVSWRTPPRLARGRHIRLVGGNVAIALLANTIGTGAALVALILTFGPISGAHLNPAVTLADASLGGLPWSEAPAYIAAQIAGAFTGVPAA